MYTSILLSLVSKVRRTSMDRLNAVLFSRGTFETSIPVVLNFTRDYCPAAITYAGHLPISIGNTLVCVRHVTFLVCPLGMLPLFSGIFYHFNARLACRWLVVTITIFILKV